MKVKVVLDLSNTSDLQICVDADRYTSSILASNNFKSPAITAVAEANMIEQVTLTQTAIMSLRNAIAMPVSLTRTDTIKTARGNLNILLSSLASLVETTANSSSVKDNTREEIIHSAGMTIKAQPVGKKRVFGATTGDIPGTAILVASGVGRGAHEWQYSADLSGNTGWISVATTLQAYTTIENLENGKYYAFRHRAIEKDGPSAWEDAVTCIIK